MMEYKDLLIEILTDSQSLTAKEIAQELVKRNYFQKNNNPISQKQIRRVLRDEDKVFFQNINKNPIKYSLNTAPISIISKSSNEIAFLDWLKATKSRITRPDKYSSTVKTISNEIIRSGITSTPLYLINDFEELNILYKKYFDIPQFKAKNIKGENMYSRAFDLYLEYISNNPSYNEAKEILEVALSNTLSKTQKESIILARIGQGTFRNDLTKVWNRCVISGYSDISLLIASHIKPWSKSNNIERLDANNGLLLLPTYDKLFDKGLISFNKEGQIMISPLLSDTKTLNVKVGIKIELNKQAKSYMKYHRENIYKLK